MERHFDHELAALNGDILRMGGLVERAIVRALDALRQRDAAAARALIGDDAVIDELELTIDEKCLDLLALWQPMAADLRFITVAMRICTELERIGDLATEIAARTLEIADRPLLKPLVDIPRLADLAGEMLHGAIDAFLQRDPERARRVILHDRGADELRAAVENELVHDYLEKDCSSATRAVPLLLIARHLERIADHCTNIAEAVIFMVQGRVVKHHLDSLRAEADTGGPT